MNSQQTVGWILAAVSAGGAVLAAQLPHGIASAIAAAVAAAAAAGSGAITHRAASDSGTPPAGGK